MIKAVVFDFDGTLTMPGAIDFAGIRKALGCPQSQPILEFLEALEGSPEHARACAVLDEFEMRAAARATPNVGAEQTIRDLQETGVPMSIVTRNCRRAVDRSLENFTELSADDFQVILTRDDSIRPKPDSESVRHAAIAMGVPVAQILCVGDYLFDIELAKNAGCLSAYLAPDGDEPALEPDYLVEKLDEIPAIVSRG